MSLSTFWLWSENGTAASDLTGRGPTNSDHAPALVSSRDLQYARPHIHWHCHNRRRGAGGYDRSGMIPRQWLVVGMLWLVACLNLVARNMVTTMHGSIVGAIPMSEAQFGLLTSAFLCVYGGMSPFAGFLSDRFGRARVIITALLVWSAVTCLTAYARTFPELLVMRILMALSEVCYMPAALALIADIHRGNTRGLAVGIHQTALAVGGMFASVGGWLAEDYTWEFAFVAVGLPSLIYGLVLSFVLRDPPRESATLAMGAEPRRA